ncbi:MAG TPA: META domain-containing protein [Acidimicrobiia bacterium]|nr:META domain-containing protein [Acidimicrobiia bacterium]
MSPQPAFDGSWTVTAYRSGDEIAVPDDRIEAQLVVEDGRISGSMGVNRFAGEIGDGLPVGALAVTRMAGPAELMAQEDILLEHLQSADAIEVVDDGMFLTRGGLFVMELERRGT